MSIDRRQILAVAMIVVGVVAVVAGGGLSVALVDGQDEDYEARLQPYADDSGAVVPGAQSIHDYRNLSAETQSLFDGLEDDLDSAAFERQSLANERAWALENETVLSIGDTTYVRHEGRLYELTLDYEIDPHGPSPVLTVVFGGIGLALLVSGVVLSGIGARRLRNPRRCD